MPPTDQRKPFQAPKGTRDFYPPDLLRRRYIEKAWRDTAIRHGFEEIDGPTFEHTDLYTVKSGEAILGEVFNVFSGKDPEQVQQAAAGRAPYALRPEFTPTLARMYAAQAGSLPKPTKWFWQQNCFRAERPQRGRLREFGQWNLDIIGGEDTIEGKAAADAEVIGCCIASFQRLGLRPDDIRLRISDRTVVTAVLTKLGYGEDEAAERMSMIDRWDRMHPGELDKVGDFLSRYRQETDFIRDRFQEPGLRQLAPASKCVVADAGAELRSLHRLVTEIDQLGISEWCEIDLRIVRGLAYYTGMVFEVHEASGAERAIAGGGRYDNLIELFGGAPTPAVGFGMGDVVLSNILQDKGLMPDGKALLDRLSEPGASLRPDVFVISNGQPESDDALRPLVADLRRGQRQPGSESRATQDRATPLHARHSYKSTKNIGKLLKEASDAHARYAAIIESATEATLKNLDAATQERIPIAEIAHRIRAGGVGE